MENQKKEKLNKIISMLEKESKLIVRKRSLAEAKQKLIQCDPKLNISALLHGVNSRDNREALIGFMCENLLTPIVRRLLSKN